MSKNIHGGGARTCEHGLAFEQGTSLNEALERAGYQLRRHNPKRRGGSFWDVCKGGVLIGYSAPKSGFQKLLKELYDVDMGAVLSRKLLPDEAFLNIGSKRLYIIEKKWQEQSGSVDEKLQTCDFKRRQYEKLRKAANNSGFSSVDYSYVLSPWFGQKQYDDMKEYIEEVGCHFYMGKIPLESMGL